MDVKLLAQLKAKTIAFRREITVCVPSTTTLVALGTQTVITRDRPG